MSQFSYKAVTKTGEHITGAIEAVDRRGAVGTLAEKGQFVLELAAQADAFAKPTAGDSIIENKEKG